MQSHELTQRSLQILDVGDLQGHRHVGGYLAVVIGGDYEEVSGDGRFVCNENTVVAHPQYHWHTNRISQRGAAVVNIECDEIERYEVATVPRQLAKRMRSASSGNALDIFLESKRESVSDASSPNIVRRARDIIRSNPTLSITTVARKVGSSVEHLARLFRQHTGTTPISFRADCRVKIAIAEIRNGSSLSCVATQLSFADQSHLGREIKRITGQTPSQFRSV